MTTFIEPESMPAARSTSALPELSAAEIQRYSRHVIIPEVGMTGQRRLRAAKVLCVGAGGLGSPLALYLAAAGIGTLGVVDFDVVDASNLQRQIIHGTSTIGQSKLTSAAARIRDLNPHVEVIAHHTRLTSENALELLAQYDVVADGTDNFPTRYLVNDACVLLGKPNVYGSIFRFEGQLSVFSAPNGPCYRCLFREPPPPGLVPSCAEGGVLGVLPGIIGTLQALETIKLLLGAGDAMVGRLLLFDALALRWREMRVAKDPECPVCGSHPTITRLIDYAEFCGIGTPEPVTAVPTMTPRDLARRAQAGEPFTLIDVREPHEWEIVNLRELGARLIPLPSLDTRVAEIGCGAPIVVHCRSGARSAKAVRRLLDAGLTNVWNLEGGILAWHEQIDPAKPRY